MSSVLEILAFSLLLAFFVIILPRVKCEAVQDNDEVAPTSTPAPTPQLDDLYHLSYRGSDCVRAIFELNLTVAYNCRRAESGDSRPDRDNCMAHVRLPGPGNVSISGLCGQEPILNLVWPGEKLRLTMKFTRDSNYWYADHVEFSFNLSDPHFPNASETKNVILSAEKGLKLFRTPRGKHFVCRAKETVPLGSGSSQHATVSMRNSCIQVFDLPPPPKAPKTLWDFFSKGYEPCSADSRSGRSQNTAFIIATCLALLVASVIAGYYFSKRSSQSPYATVD